MDRAASPLHLLSPSSIIERHGHVGAYATVVLEGGYEEAGEAGRWRVQPGDVLLHAPFSSHRDLVPPRGARLLNLPLPASVGRSIRGRTEDPDLLVRLSERDVRAAVSVLLTSWRAIDGALADAPDLLAQHLSKPQACDLQAWSDRRRVSRQTAFRWFRAAYGVSPKRYRVEARARRAWRMIIDGEDALVGIADAAGYADQSHMNREVKALTGRTPGQWRIGRAVQPSFKAPPPAMIDEAVA